MTPARPVLRAFLIGTIASAALIVASARGDVDRMTFGDGEIHRYVATHLTTPPAEIDPAVVQSGTSLRYGRIGWPAMLWATSGGSARALRYLQPVLTAVAGGAAVAAMAALLPGAPMLAAVSLFVAPGFSLSLAGGFAEAPSLALALWGLVAVLRARPWLAVLAFAAATLTKELAAAVVVGAVVWGLWRGTKGWRAAAVPALALVPVLAWHLIVRARFGHLPLLDPYLSGDRGVDLPGVGLVRALVEPASAASLVVAALHVALGVWLFTRLRSSAFGLTGALTSLPLLITTPFTPWRFIGDGFRTSIFIEAFALLALLALRRPGWPLPGAMPAALGAMPAQLGTSTRGATGAG